MILSGTYLGHRYVLTRFDGGWYVQRDGGERYAVRLKPAYCDCGDHYWRRDGLLPTPCKHVRAARAIIKASNE